jgi:hypothetical protein
MFSEHGVPGWTSGTFVFIVKGTRWLGHKGYAPEELETQGWRGGAVNEGLPNFLTSKKCGGTRYFRHFGAILGHFCNW